MRSMKKLSLPVILCTLVSAAAAQQAKTAGRAPAGVQSAKPARRPAASYKTLKYPPLNKINVPEPARFELPNGMVVYLVEDHEIPMISVSATIRTGSRWEPVAKAGLASITGTVMRTGGTTTRKGDQLDQELDRLGAVVETGIGEDSGRAMVSVLKEDIDTGLSILSDVLQNPAFPEDKIDLAKTMQRENIARRNDEAAAIASREFHRILYGKDTPYGHQTEYDTINSITRDDLVQFHKQFFQPENVILGAWGDFNTAEMRARIEKAFSGWARGGRPKPPVPEVDRAGFRPGMYSIDKEDVNQSTVLMGLPGGKRNDPDYYALEVMNSVLGGGFASRLFSNVRSDQGLAYNVGSSWAAGWDRAGAFIARGGTKSESTVKILEAIKREIERMREAEVTDAELSRAKDAILKGFAFEFDSTGKIVSRLMSYEYYGYPKDYLQRYRDNIDKVTRADVLRVAKQYLQTDKLAILVLGNTKEFDRPLSSLGQVTPVDITIPKPKQEAVAAATPESIAKGKALLNRARQAMGGAAFDKVKDYTTLADFKVSMAQGEFAMKMEATANLSGKMLSKMVTPMGEMSQGYDGQTLWMRTPQGTRELPATGQADAEGGFFRDTISLFQNIDNQAYTVQALGPAEVDGKQVETVAVLDKARKFQVKLWIDPQSNLLVKKGYTAALMGAPGDIEEFYSEFRDAGGLKLPHKVLLNRSGQKFGEQTITEIRINPGLDENAYKKPQ